MQEFLPFLLHFLARHIRVLQARLWKLKEKGASNSNVGGGILGDGIKEAVRPDVDSGVVSGNLLFILAIVALVVCKNWSLAVKGHCGGTFQNVSASVARCVSSWR